MESLRPSFCSISCTTASRCCARLENRFSTSVADALDFKTVFGREQSDSRFVAPASPVHSDKPPCRNGWRHTFRRACRAFQHRSLSSNVALNTVKCVCNCGSSARNCLCTNAAATRLPVVRSVLTALLADARGGEGFEFAERNACGFLMRLHQPLVIQRHRQHRNGFGRGAGEIIKHPALVFFLLPLRQPFAGFGILVFAERMKLFAGDDVVSIPTVPRPRRSTGRDGFHRRRSNRSAPDARRSSSRHRPDFYAQRQ